VSFPRYPKYKASGVEWLGEVPEHWLVMRFQRCVFVAEGQVDPEASEHSGMSLIAPNHIEAGSGRLLTLETADDQGAESGKYRCNRGDVVYSKIRPALRKVCIAPKDCLCSADMYPWRAHSGLTNLYLFWLILSEQFSALAVVESQRVAMPKINRESLKSVLFAVPTSSEQVTISAFLQTEVARIDALVCEQRRLIELLKEKRQAVISRAVTKGLNPHAPMKSSGIEWIGEVPKHWPVAAVRFRYTVQLGKMLDTDKITGDHLRPYLRVFDVQWGGINIDELPQMDFDPACRDRFRLAAGDLLINEGGSYPGRSAIWRGELAECYFQKALHRLRPRNPDDDTTRFFFYVMSWATARGVFTAGGNESTIEHLPAEKFRKYRFAFPPLCLSPSLILDPK
jgi:type I restriction enzyme S subunit